MGIFDKLMTKVGGVSASAIENARVGRGVITSVQPTGMSVTIGGIEERVCLFQVEIALDDTVPYTSTSRQRIPVWTMAQIQPGATTVAVRVDVTDPNRFAIDWEAPVPTVRLPQAAAGGSAAQVLAEGDPCRVIVQQFQPLGMTSPAGLPVYAFVLTVIPARGDAYEARVGNAVPAEALPLLFPGSRLPAKVKPGEANSIAIDWASATAPTDAAV